MKIENCKIPGVKLIYNDVYSDNRGKFIETYKKISYSDFGLDYNFVQDKLKWRITCHLENTLLNQPEMATDEVRHVIIVVTESNRNIRVVHQT